MGNARRASRHRNGVSRRDFLKRAGALPVAVVPLLAACGSDDDGGRGPTQGTPAFKHGVASGDPLTDRVIVWTRVTPEAAGPVAVELVVARDAALTDVVQRASVTAEAARDYTVKIDQAGLQPGSTYYYRFSALGQQSPVGRTRTAPAAGATRLRVGVVSCSSYAHGVFNAYRKLAQRADLDVVLHLGDYIYEYASGGYGSARPYQPVHEILTLEDYRTRHAYYKLDPDLQEIHRQHPFITVWDDHETANDAWNGGAQNHDPATEGSWAVRKAAGIQAYAEWLPIRLPDAANPERIYRKFSYGDLADIVMLDTRLIGRDEPVAAGNAAGVNDAGRNLLGATQLAFLSDALASSRAKWKLLGQQVMFGQLRIPSLPELSQLTGVPIPQLQQLLAGLPIVGTGGLLLNADQWDGYRAERTRVFDLIESQGVDNAVVLTGDIHTSWGMDLSRDPANPLVYNALTGAGSLGVEFVTTSVTSPGLDSLAALQGLLPLLNPHMKYVDLARKGYLLLDITPERVQGEWWYVDTVATSSNVENFGAAYASADGANHLTRIEAPSASTASPALAP